MKTKMTTKKTFENGGQLTARGAARGVTRRGPRLAALALGLALLGGSAGAGAEGSAAFAGEGLGEGLAGGHGPGFASQTLRRAPQSFWDADVWEDPDRPFLYYGEDGEVPNVRPAPKASEAPKTSEPRYDDFSRFTTVEALRKEYDRRKDLAIMHPEDEKTMLAFLAVSDHVQTRSQRFAEGWERVRLAHPEIDWTATHPLVNSVSGALKTERDGLNRKLLQTVAKESGLLWIADADNPVSHAAAPLVRAFAKMHGFSLLVVEKKGRPIGLDPVVFAAPKPDRGIGAKLGATDPGTLPALFLVPDPKTPYPTLREILRRGGALRFATGAVSVTKMGQDLLFLLVPDLEKFPKALPSERADFLRAEWRTVDEGNPTRPAPGPDSAVPQATPRGSAAGAGIGADPGLEPGTKRGEGLVVGLGLGRTADGVLKAPEERAPAGFSQSSGARFLGRPEGLEAFGLRAELGPQGPYAR